MMSQILASIEDINGFLPDLVEITDNQDRQFQVDANRLIKSNLAGVFTPAILTAWDDPATTPELIRGIAGRLIASRYYAIQFSQEATKIPEFAQGLYLEAIAMIADIRSGKLIVVDSSNNPIVGGDELALQLTDVVPSTVSGDPVFGMGLEFG